MSRFLTGDWVRLLAILLFVASLPYSITTSNIFLAILLVVILYKQVKKGQWYIDFPSPLMILFICYYAIEVFALLYTENMDDGLRIIERHIPFIIIPLVFYYQKLTKDEIYWILWSFVISCFFACLICIFVNIDRSMQYDKFFHEWMFSHDQFSDPIKMQAVYFSLYVSFSLLIIFYCSINEVNRKRKLPLWLLIIITLILSVSLILMGARTVTLITLILLLGLLLHSAWTKRAWIFGAIALIILVVFSLFVTFHPVLKNRFRDLVTADKRSIYYDGYSSRLRIWVPGFNIIKNNFWLGVGTGDGQDLLDEEYQKSNYIEGIGMHNMHNQYLQSLLNYGILGLILISAIFGFQFWIAMIYRNKLYICFIILITFSMLTESILNRNKGVLLVTFFSLLLFPGRYLSKD